MESREGSTLILFRWISAGISWRGNVRDFHFGKMKKGVEPVGVGMKSSFHIWFLLLVRSFAWFLSSIAQCCPLCYRNHLFGEKNI